MEQLRQGHPNSLLLSTGDSIGASPLASALFQDEPTIEVLNAMGVKASVVGNHEFDEGLDELRRIEHGGCYDDELPVPRRPTRGRTSPSSGPT